MPPVTGAIVDVFSTILHFVISCATNFLNRYESKLTDYFTESAIMKLHLLAVQTI
jgi:hypothetical protein